MPSSTGLEVLTETKPDAPSTTTTKTKPTDTEKRQTPWKECLTMSKAKEMCRASTQDRYSVGVIATGAKLCFMFRPRSENLEQSNLT